MKTYQDDFTLRNLPAPDQQASYPFRDQAPFSCPSTLNCTDAILDRHLREGNGDRVALVGEHQTWTYRQLQEKANRVAGLLQANPHFQTGCRILIRSANNPMTVAIWFGILKAGGVAVTTMPLLRTRELQTIAECAEVSLAFCDRRLWEDLEPVQTPWLKQKIAFDGTGLQPDDLEQEMALQSPEFENFPAFAEAVALIGFTSGTTGKPKMTAHFHRDVLAICHAFPPYALQITPEDVVTGSPPIGFTFGLGGLVLFPFYFGARTVLLEKPNPDLLLETIQKHGVTICFTAPTAWRILTTKVEPHHLGTLRKCVSAGEALPVKVWEDWKAATGLSLIDGIGATEMLHIFISANENDHRRGSLGKAIPGYEACLLDENGQPVPVGETGRLAVRGITGCKYLGRPEKQQEYVQFGWNLTGDLFRQDEEGYFYYVSRADNMIISSGYNIAAAEVESVLLAHPLVAECAVIGVDDADRGMLVCACLVLTDPRAAGEDLVLDIQNWFKSVAAPYKYPRRIHFVEALPKTETGKTQHFKLRETLL